MIRRLRHAVVLATLVATISPALAAPGDLDPTFGVDGTVYLREPHRLVELVVLPDDRLLIAGRDDNTDGFAAVRFERDGSVDRTYGKAGRAVVRVHEDTVVGEAARTPDGGLVIVGEYGAAPEPYGFAVVHLLEDGTPDPGFGAGGLALTPFATPQRPHAMDVGVMPDGRIVTFGASGGWGTGIAISRHLPDGTLDATYGTGGLVVQPLSITGYMAGALEPDGSLVVFVAREGEVLLARFDPGGALDPTFGIGGEVLIPGPSSGDAKALVRRSDGTLIAMAGWTARFDADGTLDTSYGDDGIGDGVYLARTMAVESDGDVLVGSVLYLRRVTAAGVSDPTFADEGLIRIHDEEDEHFLQDLAVDSGGRILALARDLHDTEQRGLVLHRYHGDCGDGVVQPGEACDDGNVLAGDCCSPTCRLEPAGAACDLDGDLCTSDSCDGAGTCHAGGMTPRTSCLEPTAPFAAALSLGTGGRATFTWAKGDALSNEALGMPSHTTDWAFCVYDETGGVPTLALAARVPAGGECRGKPCWKRKSTTPGRRGWIYRDPDATPDGVKQLQASEAATGKAKAKVTAAGAPLASFPLAQDARVVAELRASTGTCLGATFSTAIRSDSSGFVARSD